MLFSSALDGSIEVGYSWQVLRSCAGRRNWLPFTFASVGHLQRALVADNYRGFLFSGSLIHRFHSLSNAYSRLFGGVLQPKQPRHGPQVFRLLTHTRGTIAEASRRDRDINPDAFVEWASGFDVFPSLPQHLYSISIDNHALTMQTRPSEAHPPLWISPPPSHWSETLCT